MAQTPTAADRVETALRRDAELFALAVQAADRGDGGEVAIMRTVTEMWNTAECAGLVTAKEARGLRRDWLVSFAEYCIGRVPQARRAALVRNPQSTTHFLPLSRKLEILREAGESRIDRATHLSLMLHVRADEISVLGCL